MRVTLIHDNKPIKKKKTSVCKACSNPVWNEALVFNVPTASLEHVSLEIAVADHDLLGHSESLGVTVLGKCQSGVGGVHWKEMTSNVRKAVAKWHTLHWDCLTCTLTPVACYLCLSGMASLVWLHIYGYCVGALAVCKPGVYVGARMTVLSARTYFLWLGD